MNQTSIALETSRYRIRTIESRSELVRLLELRSNIFSKDYGRAPPPSGLDVDRFDFVADHLAIECKQTGKCVGTYRLISSLQTSFFYSGTEFKIDDFLSTPGTKLELGRACIEPEHRNGITLTLLWKGILEYASKSGARYLFGCSSVKTESESRADALISTWQAEGRVGTEWQIQPLPAFAFEAESPGIADTAEWIETPALLRSYFKAGAKVYGRGAYDREFHCVDFFTVLDLDEMEDAYERRFKLAGNA